MKKIKNNSFVCLWTAAILYFILALIASANFLKISPNVIDGLTLFSIGLAILGFNYANKQDIEGDISHKEIDDKLDKIDKKLDTIIKNTHKKRIK